MTHKNPGKWSAVVRDYKEVRRLSDEKKLHNFFEKVLRIHFSYDQLQNNPENGESTMGYLSEESLPIGNGGRIRPDTVVLSGDEQLIVEYKSPNFNTEKLLEKGAVQDQLFSYLKQRKARCGLIVADKIVVVYDHDDDDPATSPSLLAVIEFDENDKLGAELAYALEPDHLAKGAMAEFCKRLLENKLKADLEQAAGKLDSFHEKHGEEPHRGKHERTDGVVAIGQIIDL
jgi:hypothetical protein